jgi:hypothetical protein
LRCMLDSAKARVIIAQMGPKNQANCRDGQG